MRYVLFLTHGDLKSANVKLGTMHKAFEKPSEQEAVIDFARCLKSRLRQGTAKDFLTSCDQAAKDLTDSTKVIETYDNGTVGVVRSMVPFIAEKIFGKSFAEEVKQLASSGIGIRYVRGDNGEIIDMSDDIDIGKEYRA